MRLYPCAGPVKDADDGPWTMVDYPREVAADHMHGPPGTPTSLSTASSTAGEVTVTWSQAGPAEVQFVWYERVSGRADDSGYTSGLVGDATMTTITWGWIAAKNTG